MSTREKIAQIANRAVNEAEDRHRDGGGVAQCEGTADDLDVTVVIYVGDKPVLDQPVEPKAAPAAKAKGQRGSK